MTAIWFVLLALLMLGALITVHEAGHFFAARICGIEVVEFAIGMGPKIFSRKSKKGTLFSLRVFPLGGFCQFYGEDEDLDDERAFNKQKIWKRFFTISAGVLMNFLLAFVIIFLYYSFAQLSYTIPVVDEVVAESPAFEEGILPGDRLISVEGQPIETTADVIEAIGSKTNEPIAIIVERDGVKHEIIITPEYDEEEQRSLIGIQFAQEAYRLNPWQALVASGQYSVRAVRELIGAIGGIIFRGEGADQISGPLGTIYIIQEQTRQGGFVMFISLMAFISINLGFMNLLPIPGLDGSRLVFLIIEAIRKKPVNPKIEGAVHFAGFVVLIGLMILVTYQDILRFIGMAS